MKRFSVQGQLLTLMSFSLTALLVIVAIAICSLSLTQTSLNHFRRQSHSIGLRKMQTHYHLSLKNLLETLQSTENSKNLGSLIQVHQNLKKLFLKLKLNHQFYESLPKTEEEVLIWGNIKKTHQEFIQLVFSTFQSNKLINPSDLKNEQQNKSTAHFQNSFLAIIPKANELNTHLDELIELHNQNDDLSLKKTENTILYLGITVSWISGLMTLFVLLLGSAVFRGIIDTVESLKKTDRSLRKSKAVLETALSSMTDSILISNLQGEVINCNQAFLKSLKVKSKEECNKKLSHYHLSFDTYSPDGSLVTPDQFPLSRALRGESVSNLEHTCRNKETNQISVNLYSFSPIRNTADSIVGAVVVAHDITERKAVENSLRKSEILHRALFEALPLGIVVADNSGQIITSNPTTEKVFELSVREQKKFKIDDYQWKVIRPDGSPIVPEEFASVRALKEQKLIANMEIGVVRKQGDVAWFLVTAIPLPKHGIVVNYEDITERKQLENELRAAVELRDEFISIASHELKTPLAALQMQIQFQNQLLATESQIQEPRIALLSQSAYRSAQSLNKLLDELLDVTRIRAGKLKLEPLEMDLRSMAIETIALAQNCAKQKGSSIILKASAPVIGKWDPIRMNQVLSNLLSNAIKYGQGKPIEVTLITSPHSKKAQIIVKDQGIGISEDIQAKIFERFQRGVSSNKITGLGLGLYITRQIIDAHGGTIQVQSELDHGSVFIVDLPKTAHALEAIPSSA